MRQSIWIGFRPMMILVAVSNMAFAQEPPIGDLDIDEADARGAARQFYARAEDRFDCEVHEQSMRQLGDSNTTLYLFRVRTTGDECEGVLTFLTELAAREGQDDLVFREVPEPEPGIIDSPIPRGNDLIFEIDPDD